jgi:D-threo-aldose 1-dehydrogenase
MQQRLPSRRSRRRELSRYFREHIHNPDEHYEQARRGAYRALDRLRLDGTIDAVGAGMNQVELLVRFARDADFDCFLLAGRYTLLDQSALAELLPLCLERGIAVILGGLFNSGILADPRQARDIADQVDVRRADDADLHRRTNSSV